jgi:hypothetical protein
MKVYNVTQQQLEQAAAQVPCKLQNVTQHGVNTMYLTCVLRSVPETPENYRQTGNHDRRVNTLSRYGHKMFYDALFDLVPTAKVQTAYWSQQLTYDGQASYKAQVH